MSRKAGEKDVDSIYFHICRSDEHLLGSGAVLCFVSKNIV
jgi:hypothetical protein